MDITVLEQAAAQIAGEWAEQGADSRHFTDSEDLYPADYTFAAEQLGRELSPSQKRDLRAMVSEHLAGER